MIEEIIRVLQGVFQQLNLFGQSWYGLLLLFGSLSSCVIVVLHYRLLSRHKNLHGKIEAVEASVDRVDNAVNSDLREYTMALIEGFQSIQELADDLKASRRRVT